jgi:transcriptional regulator with XRE-family HTH domain
MPRAKRTFSVMAREPAELLGLMIRAARLKRNMTAQDLADRAGVSRPLLARVEKGDMAVAIGSVFEIAAILGVPLFEPDRERLDARLSAERRVGALLKKRAFQASRRSFDDNF